MATEAPKPAPRTRVFTAPVNSSHSPSSSDLKDEDLYDDSCEDELQSLSSEVKRLKNRIVELENQASQRTLNESLKQKEQQIERQRLELENARKEGKKLKNELEAQAEALKKRDFELEMEKDLHIRRKKAMDEKEFRIREMEDDLQTKIQKFSVSANAQNASTEEILRREKEVEIRELRLQRQSEDLKCFQDQLYEREGRLQQNEKILEEKFKSAIHKEQELKDQMQALDLQKQEGPPASAPAHVTTAPVRTLAPSPPPPTPQESVAATSTTVQENVNPDLATQKEIEDFYRQKHEQEELDRMYALQFEQSFFGDDEIPASISEGVPGSSTTSTTDGDHASGHSQLDIANNS